MSFTIRRISTSAAGREIVRTSDVAGDAVTIGRDPANHIVLTDLSIAPHHARMVTTAPGELLAEALTDLPIRVNGARTRRKDIIVARGATVSLGEYRITLGAGNSADTVAIDVREVTDTLDRDALARRFSLAGSAPGKRPMAWLSVLAVLAVFLAWPVLSFYQAADAKITDPRYSETRIAQAHLRNASLTADQSWSPGPLSSPHAALEKDCKACHVGAFVAVQDTTCAGCHADAHDHAPADRLLAAMDKPLGFQKVKQDISVAFGRPPGRCVDCHDEHHGEAALQPVNQQFCADCHADLKAKLPDTRLANAGDFSTAHPQFQPLVRTRAGAAPRFQRVSLDRTPQDATALKFPHSIHVSRTGAVARMQLSQGQGLPGCSDCHVPDASKVRFKPVDMETSCQSCHSLAYDRAGGRIRNLPHGDVDQVVAAIRRFSGRGGMFVPGMRRRPGAAEGAGYGKAMFNAGAAVRAAFAPGGQCHDCHTLRPAATAAGVEVVPVRQPLRYLAKGWFDHAAHAESQCVDCHNAPASAAATDLMLPDLANCRTCHVGEGRSAAAPTRVSAPGRRVEPVVSNCSMCHSYHQGEGQRPARGPERINRTVTAATTRPLQPAWRH